MRFPAANEAIFLSKAHANQRILVLIDYLAQRKVLGDMWTRPDEAGEYFNDINSI